MPTEKTTTTINRAEGVGIEDLDSPLFIAWQLTSICNLECLHCCEESHYAFPDEMNTDQIMNLCKQIVDANIPYTAISGGEPLLHRDFFKICEFLSGHNISLKVETNGLFIDEKVAKKFKRLGFRSVQISVDGATSSTHQKMRLNADYDKTIRAVKLLVGERVNAEIVFVPTRFNYGEVGKMIDMAASLGVYGFYTGKIMRIGRAAKNWSILCPTDEEYEKFFRILEAKVKEYEGRMKVYYYPYDVIEELKYRAEFPAASLLVLPNGRVKLIGPLPFTCGDFKKQSLKEVWTNYKKFWKEPRVLDYTKRVIEDPRLLADSNKWIEL